jgi:hypothetical protein
MEEISQVLKKKIFLSQIWPILSTKVALTNSKKILMDSLKYWVQVALRLQSIRNYQKMKQINIFRIQRILMLFSEKNIFQTHYSRPEKCKNSSVICKIYRRT